MIGAIAAFSSQVAIAQQVGARVCGRPAAAEAAGAKGVFSAQAAHPKAPWMAKLEVIERVGPDGSMTVSNCGASAIGERWLLTAAHCVGAAPWRRVRATLGVRDLDSAAAVKRGVDVALCHGGFDPKTLTNDLALVRLSEPLPEGFPLLRLASAREGAALRAGRRATSAGWSRVGAQRLSSRLRLARVRVIDPSRKSDGLIVAAPERDEGSLCVGESGGPLVADLGRGPAQVGVFSSVDAYRDRKTGALVELCEGFEARSYFTATSGVEGWVARTIAACEADLSACLGPGRPAAMRVAQ